MLSLKRMYIQEMAEELKLTPATVSHHINILLSMRYVLLTVDATKSKKVYYELNNEKLEGLSKSILNLASERSYL
jgi:DNA-binding transcriptional ArsR family regulator